jgi:aconitate hydratase
MGAETGATCSIFGYDKSMSAYLKACGREDVAMLADANRKNLIAVSEVYADPSKFYDQFIEIDLSTLEPHINGPFTPDIATPISKMKEEAAKNGWPENVEVALIGSCTNSSYEDISRAASVAENAMKLGLVAGAQFKVTPGSEQIRSVSERDGFLNIFRKMGGEVYANACGPCIGQWERKTDDNKRVNTIIHSFNRNFSKRTDGNPNTHGFVASPEIVTALAVAGKLTFNPLTDTLVNSNGEKVRLPEPEGPVLPTNNHQVNDKGLLKPDPDQKREDIVIDPDSERLQMLKPFSQWDGKDFINVPLLIKAKGKCTTDHISMAGFWLKFRGHLGNISANYMIGAVNSFNEKTNAVKNRLLGRYASVPETAHSYREYGTGSIVVGEENFGEGSSREHAAMEPRFLGVKAVIVKSFARIHETNLKKQGVLPLTFIDKNDYNKIQENDIIDIKGLDSFAPGSTFAVTLHHSDGTKEGFRVAHSYNASQIEWFKAGSALNIIRNKK